VQTSARSVGGRQKGDERIGTLRRRLFQRRGGGILDSWEAGPILVSKMRGREIVVGSGRCRRGAERSPGGGLERRELWEAERGPPSMARHVGGGALR